MSCVRTDMGTAPMNDPPCTDQRVDPIRKMRNALALESVDALIKWRQHWEEMYASPPDANSGHEDLLQIWEVAGHLMDAYGIAKEMS